MASEGKVLLVASSYYGPFYPDGMNTGVHFAELLIPYQVFREAGYEVQLTSETGKCKFDDHSIKKSALGEVERDAFDNKDNEFWYALKDIKPADKINYKEFCIMFIAGGHAAMFDLPHATNLQTLAQQIYASNGVLAAVCHGPVMLPFVDDTKSPEGRSVVYGKKVTAFNSTGELVMGVSSALRERNMQDLNSLFREAGAEFVDPPTPMSDFTQVDGRIVTGVNPMSAKSTAEAAIKVSQSLRKT
ncbi:D-lactate dehydratase [Schizosaccharomyces pombe]|uniref:Glutathione-independent glyoxalase hsp3101 n=1 Tax=Schizosaccharomyces pombe (strain 972 / ATCC 24843) TaxID=284812 RepID=HSP31_SCHPO|nr:ThiJ domain protein [Schizosaccharomyces pombe]O74914.1 RecName: Full=Glutathione-independent glyoxalase hsp3101; AltName: Full=Glyoxalase 3 homolog 1; AltName: Full=Heat shock protein 31 homolog 1 [Schizosaccharomyces pombe 972h-]CAA21228.1 ThiJ domain protein [Schizosaccharomyces pombe]|eukprot:NP_587678.1 ThiJ domain protein [Schizosaccharomyces pombe]